MSLQKLFQDKKALEVFEKAALKEGYKVFTKRGQFYCQSDLNLFAVGYLYGMEVKPAVIQVPALPTFPGTNLKPESISFEAREILTQMIGSLNNHESQPAYNNAEYIRLCDMLLIEIENRQQVALKAGSKVA